MRRSTSFLAHLKAQPREGTELHFENCTGGYFSDDPNYALRVMGRTEQVATTYEAYSGGESITQTKCVKAGTVIKCGDSRAVVPCDLQDGDVWYPVQGIVDRGDSMEKHVPQPMIAPAGDVDVTQEPLELEARLCATMLSKPAIRLSGGWSWRDIQAIVRCGLAPSIFKIGDQLTVVRDGTHIVLDIIGIDHDIPTDKNFKHSLTLQVHDCLAEDMSFDGRQALYYAEQELPAGTYNFHIVTQQWYKADNNKTFQFTLTKAVPTGGQIVLDMTYNAALAGRSVKTYSGSTSSAIIETATISEGTDGTALGTTDGSVANLNHIQRAIMGSNNWMQSAIRQYLNSDAAAESVWTPKSNFDRPPSWVTSTAGFLNGLDADFLAVIGEVDKITTLNTLVDGGGSETNVEKFFLLSRAEVYGGKENSISEGNAYPYYADNSDLTAAGAAADTNRIKYRSGSAQYWWLRSPNTSNLYSARYVNTTGVVSYSNVNLSNGIAPACCII